MLDEECCHSDPVSNGRGICQALVLSLNRSLLRREVNTKMIWPLLKGKAQSSQLLARSLLKQEI